MLDIQLIAPGTQGFTRHFTTQSKPTTTTTESSILTKVHEATGPTVSGPDQVLHSFRKKKEKIAKLSCIISTRLDYKSKTWMNTSNLAQCTFGYYREFYFARVLRHSETRKTDRHCCMPLYADVRSERMVME
jgi:hypothetical protein